MKPILFIIVPVWLFGGALSSPAADFFDALQPQQTVQGFAVDAVYLDGSGTALGGRFVDRRTGFIVDLLGIQSVPQAFYWVKTPPSSDKGEPHTAEHLLLGKGQLGQFVAALEEMTLASSSAYTDQLITAYHYNTSAGTEAFYTLFEEKLKALLHPDFTDEDIKREVCHIGVTADPETGRLRLEEKGTVYTEMVSAYEKPGAWLWTPMDEMLYGPVHPVINDAGGEPSALRAVTAEDLWIFHQSFYHLSNMGTIVSIPEEIPPEECLSRLAQILKNCQDYPDASPHPGMSGFDFPPPQPKAAPGTILITGYPSDNKNDVCEILLSWPAHLKLDPQEKILFDLFLNSFANGQTSRLYRLLMDSRSRVLETGANWVWASLSDYLGNPVRISLEGVDVHRLREGLIDSLRQIILKELDIIAQWEDDNADLKQFNADALSRLEAQQKWLGQFLNKPPMFGFRDGNAGAWFGILERLEKIGGFKRSLVLKDELDRLRERIQSGDNLWCEQISKWRLLEIPPYAVAIKPDPSLIQKAAADKEQRLLNKVNDLKQRWGTDSEQAAVSAYKKEFDAKTNELESRPRLPMPRFISDPPLTLDHLLQYEVLELPGGVPLVASDFKNITSSTIGLVFDLRVLPESLWVYIPLLPAVLSGIGVIKEGDTLDFSEMELRLRQETLSYAAYYSANPITGRVELILRGSAAGEAELHNLLRWMEASLHSPLLTKDNLPHLIDRVERALSWMRNRMKAEEEAWVDSPAEAWRHQDDALFMATNCFLTQTHYLQRLRWRLTNAGEGSDRDGWDKFFSYLEKIGKRGDREKIAKKLGKSLTFMKSDHCRHTAEQVCNDLRASLKDIPDESLAPDWRYLCRQIKSDLDIDPEHALAEIKSTLEQVLRTGGMRSFMISNPQDRASAADELNHLITSLPQGKPQAAWESGLVRNIERRLRERSPKVEKPVYAGLVNEDTQNGVLIFSAQDSAPWDTSRTALLNALAGNLFSGGGSHSLFTRTWEAGLAYSNGYRYRVYSGWMQYYAERCPDEAETMRFVVDVIKAGLKDSTLVEYAVALCFGLDRSASPYEERGEAMAADLRDGFTPERIAAFRRAILALRNEPGLWEKLLDRMESVYGKVLIGYGPDLADVPKGSYFTIGSDAQFVKLEHLIASAGKPYPVIRLYPRDFWLVKN